MAELYVEVVKILKGISNVSLNEIVLFFKNLTKK